MDKKMERKWMLQAQMWAGKIANGLYWLVVMLAMPALAQAAMLEQITNDPTTGLPLGQTMGGLSIIVGGVTWVGSAIFGSEMEAKAKNQVMAVVKGLLVMGTGTFILASLPGGTPPVP